MTIAVYRERKTSQQQQQQLGHSLKYNWAPFPFWSMVLSSEKYLLFSIILRSLYRGSYPRGHFIWSLWNELKARFIKFIWNDHKCKGLFTVWLFKMGFYRLQNEDYFNKKTHCWHGRCQWRYIYATKCYNTEMCSIWFLLHGIIHWITAAPYDKYRYVYRSAAICFSWANNAYSRIKLQPSFERAFEFRNKMRNTLYESETAGLITFSVSSKYLI